MSVNGIKKALELFGARVCRGLKNYAEPEAGSEHKPSPGQNPKSEHSLSDIPSHLPRTLHVASFESGGYGMDDVKPTNDINEANVISSIAQGMEPGPHAEHYPVLDIDFPAHLVPSSTNGHCHLYIDIRLTDEQMWRLCDVLADVGILEPGYVGGCKSRGYTSVRLPWLKKPYI